jgi:hypothetical protein
MGFVSSSHFSNLFRAQFNLRPSDVRGTSAAAGAPHDNVTPDRRHGIVE